jgi:2-iminobutanoate/2-iminopropanoate deaminase
MTRTLLKSTRMYAPKFRYTPCVKAGPTYAVSGIIALDRVTGALVPGGPYAETRQILSLLVASLPEWGLSLEHLVQARIYTTRMDLFGEINRAWEETFAAVEPPARTSIGVAALPLGATVECEFALYRE